MTKFKRLISMVLALAMLLCLLPTGVFAAGGVSATDGETAVFEPADYTNLLIGPGSATSAGPEYPCGAIQPSPETTTKDNGGYSRGYPVVGFGQLYCQGTGGTKSYGNFLLAPMVGDTIELSDSRRATRVVDGTESALCYQYSATFQNGISTKVTPAQNSAIYSFMYPANEAGSFLLNAGRKQDNGRSLQNGSVTVDPETNTITGGGTFSGNWNPSRWNMYFALQFDTDAAEIGTFLGSSLTPQTEKTTVTITSAQEIGAYVKFASSEEAQEVKVKLAISFVSEEKALEHLNREIPAYDYDAVCAAAREAWNEKLGVVEIETDDEAFMTRFYTALYHVNVQPRDRTNDHGEWDDFYTIWDSWKSAFPLKTLLYPEEVGSVIESFVRRANASGDSGLVMSDAYIQSKEYAVGQGGNDIENIIVDAFLKNVPLENLTWKDVYEQALVKSAEKMRTQGYVTKGWVTSNSDKTVNGNSYSWRLKPGSATLGFAVNDIAVAKMAKALGYDEDYEKYMARSKNWLNVWNDEAESDGFTGFVQTPESDGTFKPGYNPKGPSYNSVFYECTAWDASYLIHYDLDTLIEKMGGRQEFITRLKWACDHSINYFNDDGGREGYLNFTNEPSFQIPWLFCTEQVKRPDLAAETINRIIGRFDAKPMDYPGDEDNGAMSSYYIFLMTGFFPYSTTNDYYLHGSRIPKVTFHLGNGNDFTITSNYTDGNIYVQSATWNGEALDVSKLTYEQISAGGVLDFNMGSEPSDWGRMHDTTNPEAVTDLTADEAAAKNATASLSWTAAEDEGEGVVSYEIHRGTSYGFTCTESTKIGETRTTQYTDALGQEGRYWYQVVAVDGAGNKSEPAQIRVILSLDFTAPGKVTGLTVDENNLSYGIVTLKWDAAAEEDNVASYSIYQGTTEDFTPTADNLVGSEAFNTFTFVPAETGTYYYKVLALNGNKTASEPSDVLSVTIETLSEVEATAYVNHALKKSVKVNGYTGSKETGAMAVDGSRSTKWCVKNESSGTNSPLPHWIEIDLGAPTLLNRWVVAHAGAGGEEAGYNTRDFQLQYYDAENDDWATIDDVVGNTDNVTDRKFETIVAQKVRMYITKAITSGSNSSQNARVYEIELYSPEMAADDPYNKSLMRLDGVSYAVNSQAADAEGPEKTGDSDPYTKWSARYTSADMEIEAPADVTFENGVSWISIDLGQIATVKSMKYLGAGDEKEAYRTKEMYLQTSEDGENWNYVCQWMDSADSTVPNDLEYEFDQPLTSRYFRLILPVRDGANSNARVFEWHLFGDVPKVVNVEAAESVQVKVTPEAAQAGDTVDVELNYTSPMLEFRNIEVIGASGTPIVVTENETARKFSFVMPDESVTVRIYSGTTRIVEVIDLIDQLGEVTLDSGDAIQTAREAYNALTSNEKEYIHNYAVLLTAESQYAALVSAENAEAAEAAQKAAEAARTAAEEAAQTAEAAQKAAEDAAAEAAAAKAAAEAAAAEAGEDREAAEAAQVKAEEAQKKAEEAKAAAEAAQTAAAEAQTAAETAAAAAEQSNREAAEAAAEAAESAKTAAEEAANSAESAKEAAASATAAAEAQAKAQAAQAAAEEAAKVAAEAQTKAEEAQKKAEEAAASSAEDRENAEKAAREAEEAKAAAEQAQKAAEDAQAAAETAKAAAEEANKEAAASAAQAAEYAKQIAETYTEIVAIKAELIDYLAEAQKAAEAAEEERKAAEAAALKAAKYYALIELATIDTTDATPSQAAAIAEILAAAREAIDAAETTEAVEAALAAAKEAIEAAMNTFCAAEIFSDVDANAWYHESVDFMYNNGYMVGKTATEFGVRASLTRGQMVTILYRVAGAPSADELENKFSDVNAGTYCYDAVLWAAENGVVYGNPDGTFRPNNAITREQMVAILYRYAGAEKVGENKLEDFLDADKVSAYAVDAMNWAVAEGIVSGVAQNDGVILNPAGNATRAQFAAIMARYLSK